METILEKLSRENRGAHLTQEQLEKSFDQQIRKVRNHLEQISGIAIFGADGGSLNFRNAERLTHLLKLVKCIKEKAEESENILVDLFEVKEELDRIEKNV